MMQLLRGAPDPNQRTTGTATSQCWDLGRAPPQESEYLHPCRRRKHSVTEGAKMGFGKYWKKVTHAVGSVASDIEDAVKGAGKTVGSAVKDAIDKAGSAG